MPQLLARMDDSGWMTPAMAEVLNPLPPLPYDDNYVNNQARTLEKLLSDAGAPARVIGHVRLPSHTLLVVQPGHTGRLANRRQVTVDDVKAALPRLGPALEADTIDVMAEVEGAPGAFGVLVRSANHRPLVLRSLLMQPGFQQAQSRSCVVFGLDLKQSVVVEDLFALPHLLVLGASAARVHFLHTTLVTLMLFNTPAELQMALVSKEPQQFRAFTGSPHFLGRPLGGLEETRLAVQRMVEEIALREQLFSQHNAADLDAFNVQAETNRESLLPRMILALDTAIDGDKAAASLAQLAQRGPRVGVHLIVVSESSEALPAEVREAFGARLALRGATADLKGLPLQGMPMRFIDALLLKAERDATPLELCIVPPEEVAAVVGYWTRAARQRETERAGVSTPAVEGSAVAGPLPEPDLFIPLEVGEEPPPPFIGAAQTMEVILPRARALAAYLGWLSAGPLRDVLGLSEQQAVNVMDQLRAEGLLEPKMAPTLRYQRLSAPPGE